jgi:hypothetical protein
MSFFPIQVGWDKMTLSTNLPWKELINLEKVIPKQSLNLIKIRLLK